MTATIPAPSMSDELALAHCVLGGTHQDIAEILSVVRPDDFADRKARALVVAAQRVFESGARIDYGTMIDAAVASGVVDEIGGTDELTRILTRDATAIGNAGWYARRVRDAASRRRAKLAMNDLRLAIEDDSVPVAEALSRTLSAISNVIESDSSVVEPIADVLSDIVTSGFLSRSAPYVQTGIRTFDDMFGGIPAGLVVVGARPGVGKSSFCVQVARHVAQERTVLYVSLEMTRDETVHVALAQEAGVSTQRIARVGKQIVDDGTADLLLRACDRMKNLRLLVVCPIRSSIGMIRALAVQQKHRQGGLGLVVVDFLQRITPDTRARAESRERDVAEISKGLAELAKELGCPVLCPSAINRGSDRDGRKPRMSDLRESGMIESDSHMVVLLHRPEIANVGNSPATDTPEDPEIIVGKHRGGPIGVVPASFDGPAQTWGAIEGRF